MNQLWQSEDERIIVVDGVVFPEDTLEDGKGDLETLFSGKVWIAVWRAAEDGEHDMLWHVTRNRRVEKPNLLQARGRFADYETAHSWFVYPSGAGGRQNKECEVDPVFFAESIAYAWAEMAAAALPPKIAFLKLDADEPQVERVPAWLRPGLALYAQKRREMRELMEELEEAA